MCLVIFQADRLLAATTTEANWVWMLDPSETS